MVINKPDSIALTLCYWCDNFIISNVSDYKIIDDNLCKGTSHFSCKVKSKEWLKLNDFPVPLNAYPDPNLCQDYVKPFLRSRLDNNTADTSDLPIHGDLCEYWTTDSDFTNNL